MEILIIDLGHYAVKFLEIVQERKTINVVKHHKVIIDKVRPQLKAELSTEEIHIEIVQSYLEANPFDGKIIYQIPNHFTTSRYLTLPVTNRRKAELMIPFQLDDNLPFPLSKSHFTSTLSKGNGQETKALINITELEPFDALYQILHERDIVPAVLTSELSLVHTYADAAEISGPLVLIDIGYETSKCYFIINKQVVSNHVSFTAGRSVDEMIRTAYEINEQDAITYKHENAFFLTENQYDQVSQEQAHFALLMKEAFTPLIMDIKRWEVGFRVKYGHPIERFLITGGSSQINNAANFFSQGLGVQVEVYNPYQELNISTEPVKGPDQLSFSLASMAAYGLKSRVAPANFLTGNYTSSYNTNISPHSTVFLWARVAVLCLFISLGLFAERFFVLNKKMTALNQRVQRESLVERTQINTFIRAPQRLLGPFQNSHKKIIQEINTIQASSSVNAISPLVQLSHALTSNQKIDLVSFKNQNSQVEAKFTSENLDELKTLDNHLKTLGLPKLFSSVDESNNTLEVSFQAASN